MWDVIGGIMEGKWTRGNDAREEMRDE